MVRVLIATQFHRFMKSGRTEPAILGCEDPSGMWAGDYVVKLRGSLETRESGLFREMIGSILATHFGLGTPEPAVVIIETELAELIARAEPAHASQMRQSVGLNFGTQLVTGFSAWPVDKSIPEAMWQAATDIFAFDAFIQNPDRRFGNPNLFAKGDSLLVFDHEMAFSFLLDILPSPTPWKLGTQRYLADHVFFTKLKSKPIDLEGFARLLAGLSDSRIGDLTANVPAEWNNGVLFKIESHVRALREHGGEFVEEIRRILV